MKFFDEVKHAGRRNVPSRDESGPWPSCRYSRVDSLSEARDTKSTGRFSRTYPANLSLGKPEMMLAGFLCERQRFFKRLRKKIPNLIKNENHLELEY